MKQEKVLLLNADFTSEKIISWRVALVQDIIHTKNSAYVVEYSDKVIRDSADRKYFLPVVMALKNYMNIGNRGCPYTKHNVYIRDLMKCQYCYKKFNRSELTVDHIIPISRWTYSYSPSCFTNTATACHRCNSIKGNKTPQEARLTLLNEPRAITRREAFRNNIALMKDIPNEWQPYLTGIFSDQTK